LQVASLDELMATKVKVILQQIEAKDYQDIAALVKERRATALPPSFFACGQC